MKKLESKQTYYVDIKSGDILPDPDQSVSPSYKIFATESERLKLKGLFDNKADDDMSTMKQTPVPFQQYHNAPKDNHYDHSMKDIFSMIYQLGDEHARRHIKEIGILDSTNETHLRKDIENLK